MSRSRYVVVALAIGALLVGTALSHALQWLWLHFGIVDPHFVTREITLTKALSFALAIGAVVFCVLHQPTFLFLGEVADELSRVSWPTRQETGHATWVVVVTVLISSAYLGMFDALWMWLTNWLLGIDMASPR